MAIEPMIISLPNSYIAVNLEYGEQASQFTVSIADGTPNEHWLSYWPGLENNNGFFVWVKLPPGSWQLVSLLSKLTEEQAREIVPKEWGGFGARIKGYRDYMPIGMDTPPCKTALESFQTLCRSLNLEGEQIILKGYNK